MISPPWCRNINQAAASREEAGWAHSHLTKDHQALSSDPPLKNWEDWREAAILRFPGLFGVMRQKLNFYSGRRNGERCKESNKRHGRSLGRASLLPRVRPLLPAPAGIRGDSPRPDRWTGGCPRPTTGTSLALLTSRPPPPTPAPFRPRVRHQLGCPQRPAGARRPGPDRSVGTGWAAEVDAGARGPGGCAGGRVPRLAQPPRVRA